MQNLNPHTYKTLASALGNAQTAAQQAARELLEHRKSRSVAPQITKTQKLRTEQVADTLKIVPPQMDTEQFRDEQRLVDKVGLFPTQTGEFPRFDRIRDNLHAPIDGQVQQGQRLPRSRNT